jgi:hypothetical protein
MEKRRIKMNDKKENKLKPVLPEFQALSNAMMALHQATENASQAALDALEAALIATPVLTNATEGKFLRGDAGEIMRRLSVLSSMQYESRAIHGLMSNILREYGFELPVVLTRGPGSGR